MFKIKSLLKEILTSKNIATIMNKTTFNYAHNKHVCACAQKIIFCKIFLRGEGSAGSQILFKMSKITFKKAKIAHFYPFWGVRSDRF